MHGKTWPTRATSGTSKQDVNWGTLPELGLVTIPQIVLGDTSSLPIPLRLKSIISPLTAINTCSKSSVRAWRDQP